MKIVRRRFFRHRLVIACALLLAACDELGNPPRLPIGGELSDGGWSTQTKVELLGDRELALRMRELPPDDVVWVDRVIGPGDVIGLVEVHFRFAAPPPHGRVRLVCEIELGSGVRAERAVPVRAERGVAYVVYVFPERPRQIVTRVEMP